MSPNAQPRAQEPVRHVRGIRDPRLCAGRGRAAAAGGTGGSSGPGRGRAQGQAPGSQTVLALSVQP